MTRTQQDNLIEWMGRLKEGQGPDCGAPGEPLDDEQPDTDPPQPHWSTSWN